MKNSFLKTKIEKSAFVLYDASVLSVGLNRMQLDSRSASAFNFLTSVLLKYMKIWPHTYMSLEKGGMI